MTTRSTRLGATRSSTSGATTLYTTPTDRVAIVKEVLLYNETSGGVDVQIYTSPSDTAVYIRLVQQNISATSVVRIPMWMVLEPGDRLELYASAAGASVWLSGAELLLPTAYMERAK